MRIDSSGNVGIGTASPTAKLEVNGGDGYFYNTNSFGGIRVGFNGTGTNYWDIKRENVSTGRLAFFSGTSERMALTPAGNLGIGTTSPDKLLHLAASSGATLRLESTTTGATTGDIFGAIEFETQDSNSAGVKGKIDSYSEGGVGNASLRFFTGNTTELGERMRIDSSGSLLVNTTSAGSNRLKIVGDASRYGILSENLSGYGAFNLKSTTVAQTWSIGAIDNSSNSDLFIFGGSSAGTKVTLDSSGNVGITAAASLRFNSTADNTHAVGYDSTVDGSFIRGQSGVRVLTGTGSGTERMRIDSSGNLLVGKTASNVATLGQELRANGETFHTIASANNTLHVFSSTANAYRFFVSHAGQINATATSISAISDERLKENIKDLETGLSEVMSLKPRRFDWKNGDGENVAGFIAQEVETVLPDLIGNYLHEELDDAKSVRMGDMLPTLVKAIQEQQTQIDALQSEINELKNS